MSAALARAMLSPPPSPGIGDGPAGMYVVGSYPWTPTLLLCTGSGSEPGGSWGGLVDISSEKPSEV
jgi:hypothetical protein